MKRIITVAGVAMMLGACSILNPPSSAPNAPLPPPTANPMIAKSVVAAEQALTVLERLALKYVTLPRCPAARICSDPAIVSKIRSLDNQAYNAVMAARRDESLIDAALSAVQLFRTVVPQ